MSYRKSSSIFHKMQKIFYFLIIAVLTIFLLRSLQIIEFSGAKFEQHYLKSNVVRASEPDSVVFAFSYLENNSHGWHEDGWISLFPDYQNKLKQFVDRSTPYQIEISGLEEIKTKVDGELFTIQVEVDSLDIQKLSDQFISKNYGLFVSGDLIIHNMETNSSFLNENRRSFRHKSEIEIIGFPSKKYKEYKLQELWLSHVLKTVNDYVSGGQNWPANNSTD